MVARVEFTPAERDLVRREFMVRFGSTRPLVEGIMLKRWATGPNRGKVKLSKTEQGMVERGLIDVQDAGQGWPVGIFTKAGIAALRVMVTDRRQLDAEKYRHLIDELASLDTP
ncbi:MAG: hypothetical protein GC168_19860 [Candidatus Hydrogenedens sp.]|nr:hypothetical protein [Candidatus Hydrogenedens sp.]